jgi:ParB family transcriptional regulator, chromosome partitioning protein
MSNPEPKAVKTIPVGAITVLNPRVRNKRNFEDMVESIRRVGLKRPVTVTRLDDVDGQLAYGLVCGQGRLEACIHLGQREVPAIVIDAAEAECLVMSLVENCARRHHRAIDLLQDIQTLAKRGYTDDQIGAKIGLGHEWVNMIRGLLAKGEQRLLMAVESGTIPISVAVEIARTEDDDLQALMTQAYTEGKLSGPKLIKLRWILERRKRIGKRVAETQFGRTSPARRPTSTDALIRVYRQEADRQRLLVKKAEVTQTRLLFVVEAVRTLRDDDNFLNLLRAEGLDDMPSELADRLVFGGMRG